MSESVNPTLLNRISAFARPDFARTVRARRIVAGLLVLSAGVAALRPDPTGTPRKVVVAARDLRPGITMTAEDVALQDRSAGSLPDGAETTLDAVVGATLTGPCRRGELLTDARVLGSRTAELSVGPDARAVPLHVADGAVLDLIRPGDVVDVLGAPRGDSSTRPRVLAADAVVVLISPAGNERVVLVGLPASTANTLAGASLVHDITLTIH